jgi:exodeoxyribonuclease-3
MGSKAGGKSALDAIQSRKGKRNRDWLVVFVLHGRRLTGVETLVKRGGTSINTEKKVRVGQKHNIQERCMKLYSWNVNGFRAVVDKGFWDWFNQCDGDVICLQEIKAEPEQVDAEHKEVDGYTQYWNPAQVKKGYSGVLSMTRVEPLSVVYGLPDERFQGEGRLIQMEFNEFFLFNVYFPNGKISDQRLQYKMDFYDAFFNHAQKLRKKKPIVVCGDVNTAHTEIDLKNPKANEKVSGFLPSEREWIDKFLAAGYIDTFRMFVTEGGHYTWWTYRFGARKRNAGWRIDYFFVSEELRERVTNSWIESDVMGSDHCPIGLELK